MLQAETAMLLIRCAIDPQYEVLVKISFRLSLIQIVKMQM